MYPLPQLPRTLEGRQASSFVDGYQYHGVQCRTFEQQLGVTGDGSGCAG